MLDLKYFALMTTFSIMILIPIIDAEASSNPNLFVSAENSQFDNHFSGSMVVEVVIRDNDIHDTDQGLGEPDVTLNGKNLRMIQATDGNWYAYFANIDKAKIADSTVGLPGEGLDFGSICTTTEGTATIGVDLNDADGIAYPYNSCNGAVNDSNNVVRKAKSPNTNSPSGDGQIGINIDTWPFIQLFSFDDVTIQYNPAGNAQKVDLEYDEISNISFSIDRDLYPSNAEVFLIVNDFQLNQDPTDEDSWTFNVGSTPSTFYQAYDNNGSSSANGGTGLVDLVPNLSNIGFEDNGKFSIELRSVLKLQPNDEQPDTDVSDGTTTYSEILTLVEDGPNSGIFDNADNNDQSVLKILDNAPRGQTGLITYNDQSISVLTGSSSAAVSVTDPILTVGDGSKSLKPGTEFSITLVDPDQNVNSSARDNLNVFRASTIIPTMIIGNPVTFENARDVLFHTVSFPTGDDANSSVPDSNRLIIDTSTVINGSYESISVNLGVSSSSLASSLLDVSESNTHGTNWINYDLRSFENDLGVSDFGDTSFSLYFNSLSGSSITIVDPGDISSSKGFIQIDDSDVNDISNESGNVFLVIDFGSSGIPSIDNEDSPQPIIFDFFSFGIQNNNGIHNSIYRFELEETSDNSSTFEGTLEYSVANQLNILNPTFIQTIRPINDQVKFIITDRLIDDEGISISYSDLDVSGVFTTTSTKSDINTNAGTVSSNSQSYRFGQPVTLILHDPDLNLKHDSVDTYFVINDPNSPNVDVVGKNGVALLEVLIKDIRYKRCTVDGVEYGGLGATGFTLVETGPSTGIFEGVFKMPSKICNKSGTALISSAGGSLDAKYYDSRDSSGNQNVFSLLKSKSTSSFYSTPTLTSYDVVKPHQGKVEEIILSGSIDNHVRGMSLSLSVTTPDGKYQNFEATLSSNGSYKSIISINENSLTGIYEIKLSHNNSHVDTISFVVSNHELPNWIKNNAKYWSSDLMSNSEFIKGIEYLVEEGFLIVPDAALSASGQELPNWIKNNAKWWTSNQISDEDFVKSIQYLLKKGIIRI